jgi:hypothetical protein
VGLGAARCGTEGMAVVKTRMRLYARELLDPNGFDAGSGVLGVMFAPWGFHDAFDQLFAGCSDDEVYQAECLAICALVEGPLADAIACRDGLTFTFRWRACTSNPFRADEGSVRDGDGNTIDDGVLAASTTYVDVPCHEVSRALRRARDEVVATRSVAV